MTTITSRIQVKFMGGKIGRNGFGTAAGDLRSG